MSYRMELKKNDKRYPVPKVGDKFIVMAIYLSTGKLFEPVFDVQLAPYPSDAEKREHGWDNDLERS